MSVGVVGQEVCVLEIFVSGQDNQFPALQFSFKPLQKKKAKRLSFKFYFLSLQKNLPNTSWIWVFLFYWEKFISVASSTVLLWQQNNVYYSGTKPTQPTFELKRYRFVLSFPLNGTVPFLRIIRSNSGLLSTDTVPQRDDFFKSVSCFYRSVLISCLHLWVCVQRDADWSTAPHTEGRALCLKAFVWNFELFLRFWNNILIIINRILKWMQTHAAFASVSAGTDHLGQSAASSKIQIQL